MCKVYQTTPVNLLFTLSAFEISLFEGWLIWLPTHKSEDNGELKLKTREKRQIATNPHNSNQIYCSENTCFMLRMT